MESTILVLALSVVKAVIKNPAKRLRLRAVLLQIRNAIDAAFGDD